MAIASAGVSIIHMSRGTTRPFKKQKERQHPSIYFFLVLALGVILLMWMFTVSIHEQPKKSGALGHFNRISAGMLRTAISLPVNGERTTTPRRGSRLPEIETRSPRIV